MFRINDGNESLLVQIYVDDIIFSSASKELCEKFSKLMGSEFEMSMMGELNYFLGLQVNNSVKGSSLIRPSTQGN